MPTFFRNQHHTTEPVWHLQITLLVTIGLRLLLPDRYTLSSRWPLVVVELLLLVALGFTTPKEAIFRSISRRINVFLVIFMIGVANSYALIQIAHKLLESGHLNNGRELILAAVNIYLTNIIVFAIWYWEMDGGGPGLRRQATRHEQDFLFPQNQDADYAHSKWHPTFVDYLYVSSTNGMAFSPTDTMPLTRRAKLLMLAQATISLVTVALVAARAVNILN